MQLGIDAEAMKRPPPPLKRPAPQTDSVGDQPAAKKPRLDTACGSPVVEIGRAVVAADAPAGSSPFLLSELSSVAAARSPSSASLSLPLASARPSVVPSSPFVSDPSSSREAEAAAAVTEAEEQEAEQEQEDDGATFKDRLRRKLGELMEMCGEAEIGRLEKNDAASAACTRVLLAAAREILNRD